MLLMNDKEAVHKESKILLKNVTCTTILLLTTEFGIQN